MFLLDTLVRVLDAVVAGTNPFCSDQRTCLSFPVLLTAKATYLRSCRRWAVKKNSRFIIMDH